MVKVGTLASAGIALALALALPFPAFAHPHVYVKAKAVVLYDNGKFTGIEHVWTFDELYSEMAVEGLDTNGDGKYDREELAELAKVNLDGLKEFDFFTSVKLGAQALAVKQPSDAWLEYAGSQLTMHFKLPLAEPVLAEAKGFNFVVADPSFFIAFELEGDAAVTFGPGAPASCSITIAATPKDSDQNKRLGDAFANTLGGGARLGASFAKPVAVSCPKS